LVALLVGPVPRELPPRAPVRRPVQPGHEPLDHGPGHELQPAEPVEQVRREQRGLAAGRVLHVRHGLRLLHTRLDTTPGRQNTGAITTAPVARKVRPGGCPTPLRPRSCGRPATFWSPPRGHDRAAGRPVDHGRVTRRNPVHGALGSGRGRIRCGQGPRVGATAAHGRPRPARTVTRTPTAIPGSAPGNGRSGPSPGPGAGHAGEHGGRMATPGPTLTTRSTAGAPSP